MLHLLGYDHMNKSDEQIMFAKQEEILQKLGLTRAEEPAF
jgi:probable rRNA maturation factor